MIMSQEMHQEEQGSSKKKPIIIIIDNRQQETNHFRCSGFKETVADCEESEGDLQLQILFCRLRDLEQRVQRLESEEDRYQEKSQRAQWEHAVKYRRKANQILKMHRCPHKQCDRPYGSETALKNHLKIKHLKNDPAK